MRKNRGYKKGDPFRDARLFLIACEGEDREKVYFERLGHGSKRLKVHVLAADAEKALSAPKYVLDRLVSYIEKQGINIETGDSVWMVADVDRWKINQLYDIAEECKLQNWGYALSNPCFEVWLLLHIKDIQDSKSVTCKDFKRELSLTIKGGYNPQKFTHLASGAVARCESLNYDIASPLPEKNTTSVHLVVKEILDMF